MTLFAWLAGLLYPACAALGAQGLPPPPLLDPTALVRPASPNTALAAPQDFADRMAVDVITPLYPVPASRLYAAIRQVGAEQPRVFVAAEYAEQMQIHWVARSAWWNFPDLITAQVSPIGSGASTLLLYSRSVYGYSDLGVNRKRITTWLAALDSTLTRTREK